MSDRALQALITVSIGLALLLALRVVLGAVFERYVKRRRSQAARLRRPLAHAASWCCACDHRLRLRRRALERARDLPATEQVARTLLASGAFVALILGVAFSVPREHRRGNPTSASRFGSAIATVGDVTGTAQETTLIHTILKILGPHRVRAQLTDDHVDGRQQVARRSSPLVTVRLPVAITAPLEEARGRAAANDRRAHEPRMEDPNVSVVDVGEKTAWLAVSGYALGRLPSIARRPTSASVDCRRSPLRASSPSSLRTCAAYASRPARQGRSTSVMQRDSRGQPHVPREEAIRRVDAAFMTA